MDRNTTLGAAAGVTLAVVGAVSALFLTLDQPADAASITTPEVEYVDQYGNSLGASPIADAAAPGVVFVNPDGTLVDTNAPAASGAYAEGEGEEYEDDEHEEAEHGEEYEGEEAEYDEHGEEMEYDEAGDYEDGDEDEDEDDEDEDDEDEDDDYEDDEDDD